MNPDDLQPGAEPAPAAEPAAPAAEPAAEPAAPVTPPVEPSAEDKAAEAEDNEWDTAADEIFPGLKTGKKKEEEAKKDEPAKPAEKPKEGEPAKAPDDPAKPGEEPAKPADDDGAGDEEDGEEAGENEPDTARLDARIEAREERQQTEAVKSDVRKQMFADIPTELRDAEGDPITTIEDVMALINPRTGKPFTDVEAGQWLTAAQSQFNRNLAEVDKQVEYIAQVNMDLKDEADVINYRYGELLKVMPDLRDELWADYQNTLVKDAKSGIIVKSPVSLVKFYERALEPYAQMGRKAEEDETTKTEADKKAADDAKKAEEEAKKKERQDRSDIFGGGKTDEADPEDKEWDEAAVAVFGPKKK